MAIIQVSIALREEHYSKIQKARAGRLKPEFQSRLGCIIGTLYSCVATKDWEKNESKDLRNKILDVV